MDYDKNSFLAGMSVGMTMKGWTGGGAGKNTALTIIPVQYKVLNIPSYKACIIPNISSIPVDYEVIE